jgi:uncharacterized protein YqjF (DUF2071 family)
MRHDFNDRILEETVHRPWPMPASPWIMTQTWHDLLFAHWPIPPEVLRARVPAQLPLDLFEGQAWLGIVPFHMSNVAPRGVPALPGISAFPELNVRTYVSIGGKPGVYFFSLDATNPIAVRVARAVFHLPYYTADMTVRENAGEICYTSRRTWPGSAQAELDTQYAPVDQPRPPRPGTLEYFLTERYCLYTLDRRGRTCILEIHHPPWPLQNARAAFRGNTMAEAMGVRLPDTPPLLHFSRRQDMVGWPLWRL